MKTVIAHNPIMSIQNSDGSWSDLDSNLNHLDTSKSLDYNSIPLLSFGPECNESDWRSATTEDIYNIIEYRRSNGLEV